uniref:Uncharacterized protein n=1 Tax=Rhizophora mucronata TaxID=61149 RepID=A0A2P2NUW3_RHIMU
MANSKRELERKARVGKEFLKGYQSYFPMYERIRTGVSLCSLSETSTVWNGIADCTKFAHASTTCKI